jgi:hypothetical protein
LRAWHGSTGFQRQVLGCRVAAATHGRDHTLPVYDIGITAYQWLEYPEKTRVENVYDNLRVDSVKVACVVNNVTGLTD